MSTTADILVATEAGLRIDSIDDVSDAIGACFGMAGLVLTEADLGEGFFALRTGVAGELFQKLTNYQVRAAIVVADFDAYGDRFRELAYEHASHGQVRFVHTRDDALAWLTASR